MHKHNRVGGKRCSFSPTFVFRPLTPPTCGSAYGGSSFTIPECNNPKGNDSLLDKVFAYSSQEIPDIFTLLLRTFLYFHDNKNEGILFPRIMGEMYTLRCVTSYHLLSTKWDKE